MQRQRIDAHSETDAHGKSLKLAFTPTDGDPSLSITARSPSTLVPVP